MKRLFITVLAIIIAAALVGCGHSGNTGHSVTGDRNDNLTAIIKLADGSIIKGDVDFYKRWSDHTIQVEIDGVIYTVHPLCVTLISEG